MLALQADVYPNSFGYRPWFYTGIFYRGIAFLLMHLYERREKKKFVLKIDLFLFSIDLMRVFIVYISVGAH